MCGEQVKCNQAMANESKMRWKADKQEKRDNKTRSRERLDRPPQPGGTCRLPPKPHEGAELHGDARQRGFLSLATLEKASLERVSATGEDPPRLVPVGPSDRPL